MMFKGTTVEVGLVHLTAILVMADLADRILGGRRTQLGRVLVLVFRSSLFCIEQ